jgi:type I restriction enzyme S subunit
MAAVNEISGSIARTEVREYKQVSKGYTPFCENDVLFAKITPCMQNGKAAIARGLLGGLGFGSTEFHVLRPSSDLLPQWVFAFIRQPSFRSAAEANFTGSAGQQRVPTDFLKKFPIPVPPLAEQERIVKLLDEADELRKLRAQADQRTAALIPALFDEMFGDPKVNPKGWPQTRLGKEIAVQGGYAFKSQDFVESGARVVKIANVHFETLSWIEEESLPVSYLASHSTFSLRKGDILIALTRPIIKSLNSVKVARITDSDLPCLLNQRVGRFLIRREGTVDESYLQSYCYTSFFREQISSFCSVSLQPNVSTEQVESIPFLLPPFLLQKEFAKRVTEIREMEAAQKASRERLEALFQSMLHRAFNGEL